MIVRIYTGEDGQSHFEKIDLDAGPRAFFQQQDARGFEFRFYEPGKFMDWHPAPRRQYVITLSGQSEIKTGDGTAHRFKAGDVMLADDLTGQGHTTRAVSSEPWVYATVPLP